MDIEEAKRELLAGAALVIERAIDGGARQAEAGLSHDEGLSVAVRMGELESVERQQDRGLAITVYLDGSKGSVSTSDFSEPGLTAAVDKALSIARFTNADPCAGLADAEDMATDVPDLDLSHPWLIDVVEAERLALIAEDAARGADARIANSEGASVATSSGVRVYANSHGFSGGYASSAHSLSTSVVAKSNGSLERDYWYTSSRVPTDLESPESVGLRAAERAVSRLDSRQLSTRVVPVLFRAEIARGLFGHMVAGLSGTSQYRKASFLLDSAGTKVFPDNLNVIEDPHIPQAFGSAPFDGEGVRTVRRKLVADGIISGYVLSSYSARRLGLKTTGNAGGAHTLVVESTAGSYEDIVGELEAGFVVTELLGQGVNTVTGDYSRGAAGFWVERGEIQHAVSEVTIAGNLLEMFRNVAAVGSDVDLRGAVRTGSVLIDGMTVAGQ